MNSNEVPEKSAVKKLLSSRYGSKIELFVTGFIQICLVTANTYLIAREVYIAMFFVGFLISFIWSYNVKKIAFGSLWDRVAYALGAGTGGIVGLHIIKLML